MNFQKILKIENADFYIDVAFRRAGDESSKERSKKHRTGKENKSKNIELVKLETIGYVLDEKLGEILRTFPTIDKLPEFYITLIKATLDYGELKKSLGAVMWAKSKIQEFTKIYRDRMKRSPQIGHMNAIRREYYGRISSFVKQIKRELNFIENARRTMKNFPDIKNNMKTVTIAGFPNTGKTTLLFKLTGSRPEIAPYAFTTKGINTAYIDNKIQVLDTPGTLNRFDKMNIFEKQAYLAVKMLADVIIYVFDVTEPFPLPDQEKLYKEMLKFGKPIIVYISKTDILEKKYYEEFAKKYDAIIDAEKIKEKLKESVLKA